MVTLNHSLDPQTAIIDKPLTIAPGVELVQAIAMMSGGYDHCNFETSQNLEEWQIRARSSCILVVEGGQLVGIFTQRDLVKILATNSNTEQLKVKDVMIHPVVSITTDELGDIFVPLEMLRSHGFRHLPVLDRGGKIQGLITYESIHRLSKPINFLAIRSVAEVMDQTIVCGQGKDTLLKAAQTMSAHNSLLCWWWMITGSP
ncbi:MAG: CBS domain-containing protein [Synechococcaceae cyanobacterium RL_1_2]|nr:CBS domain-containing protein [Synechococcaceae cyanobacterium RL_1_2]